MPTSWLQGTCRARCGGGVAIAAPSLRLGRDGDNGSHHCLPATTSVNTDVTMRQLPWRNARRHAANTGRRGGVPSRRPQNEAVDGPRARAAGRAVRQLCGRVAALRGGDEQRRGRHPRRTARRPAGPPWGACRRRRQAGYGCRRRRGGAVVGARRDAGHADRPLPADARRLPAAGPRAAHLRHSGAHRRGQPRRIRHGGQPGGAVPAGAARAMALIAGLFRAVGERDVERLGSGLPAVEVSSTLGRAALWRAARSGLEGELVDISGAEGRSEATREWSPVSRPAAEVVAELVRSLRPQLEAAGDWPMIRELTRQVLIAGTSAARQRRGLRRRGRLTDVGDQLIAGTAGTWPNTAAAVGEDPSLLFGYHPSRQYDPADKNAAMSYDEAIDPSGLPRPRYEKILHTIADLGVAALRSREGDIEQEQRADNITFRVTGQSRAQLFPVDLMPRVVAADEWSELTVGLGQRARALNAFLRDIYTEQAIVADGVIGVHALDRAPGFRATGRLSGDPVRAPIRGPALVS